MSTASATVTVSGYIGTVNRTGETLDVALSCATFEVGGVEHKVGNAHLVVDGRNVARLENRGRAGKFTAEIRDYKQGDAFVTVSRILA